MQNLSKIGQETKKLQKMGNDVISKNSSAIFVCEYNNNQWCSVVYRVLDQRRGYFDTRKKSLETRSEAECF